MNKNNLSNITPKLNLAGGQPYANFWKAINENGEFQMHK